MIAPFSAGREEDERMAKKKKKKKASKKAAKRRTLKVKKGKGKAVRKKTTRKSGPAKRRASATPRKAARKPARTPPVRETLAASAVVAPASSGEMYGEGNWKADEDYRRGLEEFAKSHEEELMESEDEPEQGEPGGAEDESETEW
jgi:hypothetical protein